MAIPIGTRLGPYEIESALGAGGMGEVYRARDTRLDRTVAIKVLHNSLGASPGLKARFEREARTISQLNHPHICVLHDVGCQDGSDFLVMEFIEGESLAARLQRGPLPLDLALKTGCEIADALDRAHRAGIIHRDLKPGNIMLTKTGAKLLDFGLAKTGAMGAATCGAPLVSAAVTITSPSPQQSPLTQNGAIIGTVQYMSPEQIQGRETDARSDIFALGAVLYEMLTGKRAFEGRSQLSVASAILEKEPEPVGSLQRAAPPALDHVIRTCLAKDQDKRYQSAFDVGLELDWIASSPSPVPAGGSRKRELLTWAAVLACLIAAVVAGFVHFGGSQRAPAPEVARFSIAAPVGTSLEFPYTYPALSPDGKMIAFIIRTGDRKHSLALRNLSSVDAQAVPNTDGAERPFWSPDGRYLAFVTHGELEKIAVSATGIPEPICSSPAPAGATWSPSGVIVFSSEGSLYRVDAAGGRPTLMRQHGESDRYRYPQFLPDGQHVLYTSISEKENLRGAFVASVTNAEVKRVADADYRVLYSAGFLLFVQNGDLFVQRFDTERLQVSSEPRRLPDRVHHMYNATRDTAITANLGEHIAYLSRPPIEEQLSWFDRSGRVIRKVGPVGEYRVPVLSPDGTKLVFDRLPSDAERQVWVMDLKNETLARITSGRQNDWAPLWSPDGRFLAFCSDRDGPIPSIYLHSADGLGGDELLFRSDFDARTQNWGQPGLILSGKGLQLLTPGDRKLRSLLDGQYFRALFSPDGKFIAYDSAESGTSEVYIQRFPVSAERWRVSVRGGVAPQWRSDGRELYYLRLDGQFVATSIQLQPEVRVGAEQLLFQAPLHGFFDFEATRSSYAVAHDGSKFLFADNVGGPSAPSITVVLNWTAMLQH